MDKARLQQLLAELHGELRGATSVDAASREMLEKISEEIQALTGSHAGPIPETATNQLEEATLRLEAEHPRLAGILGQISDTLAKLGI